MTVRAFVLQLLGEPPLPVAADLAVRSESALPWGRRLLVEYAVGEGERVPAYLLIPAARAQAGGGWPGVVAVHRHAGQFWLGKSEPAGLSANATYHYGLELCRRGYVVLCPDLPGFEDRRPPEYQRAEGTVPDGEMYERFLATRLLLEGGSLRARHTFELVRALDVLASLDVVDAGRLGAIGHGLGGHEAFWLAWYDARVRAAVCSCGLGTLRSILRRHIVHSLAFYLPGLLRVADFDALAADLAPCPFLLAAAEEDPLFPAAGVREIVAAAQAAYARAGVPEQFRALIFPGGHSFPQAVREEAYRFLDRWLKGAEAADGRPVAASMAASA